MGAFGGMFITNKGRALQAKAQTGVQLQFTRIAVGDGSLSGQTIAEMNALISQKKTMNLTKLKTLADGKAVVGCVLSNQDVTTGFYFRELGVFAQDPDVGEILYCYGNAGNTADYIPAGGGAEIYEKHIDVVTIIGNAQNVTATIDQSLVYATKAELEEITEMVRNYIEEVDTTSKDTTAGVYTTIRYRRPEDNTLYMQSVLSNKTGGYYTTDTWTFFAANGSTVVKTIIWNLTYDTDGMITNKTFTVS